MRKILQEILKQTVQSLGDPRLNDLQGLSWLIERPKMESHGDYASNIAFELARPLKEKPLLIAQKIIDHLTDPKKIIKSATLAGGGFINFVLNESAWQESLKDIEAQGKGWFQSTGHQGLRINVEFVSANPTGPLHIGNARGGPLGDVIAALLERDGATVYREYLVNDVGGQVGKLGESILLEAQKIKGLQASFETQQYTGPYVAELATLALEKSFDFSKPETAKELSSFGLNVLREQVRDDVAQMGIDFDVWTPESEMLSSGKTAAVIEKLRQAGVVQKKEGAEWFVPPDSKESDALEDRESVLIRSTGEPTYFANDIAYHADKFDRGFNSIIDVWGSNHHAHIPRVRSALAALGYDADRFQVILYQYVRVKRGNEAVKMSKRAGDFVLAREVLDEVGRDAFRFFLLYRAPSSHLDFDLELATKKSSENPVYYVQYAHARIASVLEKAQAKGISLDFSKIDLKDLNLPEELGLIRALHDYPFEIQTALKHFEPHRIPYYLIDLSKRLQVYYSRSKEDARYHVLSQTIDTARAKLYLLTRVKAVLSDGLALLGISAPERMESLDEGE